MCGSNIGENAAIIATGGLAAPVIMYKKAADKQVQVQKDAIASQEKANAEAKAQRDAIGTQAKTIDLTKDPSVYEDLKKNKIAMQQGIMGTIKSNPLSSSSAPVATQKTTLGS